MSDDAANLLWVRFDADITKVTEKLNALIRSNYASAGEVKKAWKDLELQRLDTTNKLAVAQAAGNKVEIAALQEQLALQTQIVNFRKLGLTVTEAQVAAEKQIAALRAAEALAAKAEAAPNIGLAATKVFDRSRLAVAEEGGAKLGVFGSALEPLGPAGLAAAAGIVAVAVAMERAVKAAEWAEDLSKTAEKLGLTTTKLQELDYVALKSGIPIEQFHDALLKGNAALGAFQSNIGDGKIKQAFQALGFTKDQLRGYNDIADLLPQIADRIDKLGSSAEKAQIAKKLGIEELLPILLKGSAGISGLTDEAHKLGIVIDEDLIKKGAESAQVLKTAGEVIDKNLKSVFLELAPTVASVSTHLAEAAKAVADFGKEAKAAFAGIRDLADKLTQMELALHGMQGLKLPDMSGPAKAASYASPFKGGVLGHWVWDKLVEHGQVIEDEKNAPPGGGHSGQHVPGTHAEALAPGPKTPKGPKDKTDSFQAEAQTDRDEATKRVDEAYAALTEDIIAHADLEKQIVDDELKAQNDNLDAQIKKIDADKSLTAAKKKSLVGEIEFAKASNELAAWEKQAKITRDAEQKLDDQALAQKKVIAAYQDQIWSDEAAMAKTAAARAAIDATRLEKDQRLEREELNTKTIHAVTNGGMTPSEALAERTALVQRQQADSALAAAKAADEIAKEAASVSDASLQTQITTLQDQEALARSSAERRAIALHLLDLEKQLEAAKLQEIIASQTASDAQKAIAREQLKALDTQYDAKRQSTLDSTAGPLEAWRKTSLQSAAEVRDAFEEIVTKGIDSFNDGLADAIVNAKSWGDVMRSVIQQIEKDLITLALKQAEASLFGGGGLGGIFGVLGKAVGIGGSAAAGVGETASSFGGSWAGTVGTFASGTDSAPGGPAIVGERGPELVNLPRGAQVVPNDSLVRSLRSPAVPAAQTTVVHQTFVLDARYGITTPQLIAQVNAFARQEATSAGVKAYTQAMNDAPGRMQKFNRFGK